MPTGQPDWWGATPRNELASVGDMGELAVRLGGISVFTRSGNVTYYHSFERGRAGWTGVNLGYCTEFLNNTNGIFGKLCYGITTDGNDSHQPGIYKRLFLRTYGKTGNEWCFNLGADSSAIEIIHEYSKSGYICHAAIKWDLVNKTISCYTPSGYVQFASNVVLTCDYISTHIIKMICDLDIGYYDVFIGERNIWDLSDKQIYRVSSVSDYYNYFRFNYWSKSGLVETVYLSYFIFTQDEP